MTMDPIGARNRLGAITSSNHGAPSGLSLAILDEKRETLLGHSTNSSLFFLFFFFFLVHSPYLLFYSVGPSIEISCPGPPDACIHRIDTWLFTLAAVLRSRNKRRLPIM
jgi:hypothetical protein